MKHAPFIIWSSTSQFLQFWVEKVGWMAALKIKSGLSIKCKNQILHVIAYSTEPYYKILLMLQRFIFIMKFLWFEHLKSPCVWNNSVLMGPEHYFWQQFHCDEVANWCTTKVFDLRFVLVYTYNSIYTLGLDRAKQGTKNKQLFT